MNIAQRGRFLSERNNMRNTCFFNAHQLIEKNVLNEKINLYRLACININNKLIKI